MCGIFGCVLKEGRVAPILHQALKRLEYRGYDSCGEATVHEGKLYIKKDAGKIDEVHAIHNLDDLPGRIGISHTRWATHGAPYQVNAHPHTDCTDRIAIVHNGIIENYQELRERLTAEGHLFSSDTDSEVIAHLVEKFLDRGLTEAVRETADTLAGIRQAKSRSVKVLSLCNVLSSTIAGESDAVLDMCAGSEIGVASTKAYTCELVLLYLLSVHLAEVRWALDEEVRSRRGRIIAVATEGDKEVASLAEVTLFIPDCPEELSPILAVVPLQLLAYHVALLRGCDVDKPRNLAKSVTVE